ncbi:cytochrome P450 [Lasiosphaeria miniovina]|uniref:Cytochrome P450 n=1 Tax=Lasiosphaeria miniovina TaxID=1954250 RepID=A0AA40EDV7_9PEZI|nr:cytochrome P450 [Lasiosphaeria miniovina]KAK0734752.1 cytochrome P450 [Lasiosphaeria miniovina]
MLGPDLVGAVSNGRLLFGFALGLILWRAAVAAYNFFLHPLRRFPGPMFATQKLHERYGPVVRIASGYLSFTDVRAYKDIYGSLAVRSKTNSNGPALEMPKAAAFYDPIDDVPTVIVNAGREEHQRVRRAVSQGFSEAALRQYEPVIGRYVGQLLRQMHERSGAPLDCAAWYMWATFDIAAKPVFGKPIGCLDACAYHPPVVQLLFRTFGQLAMTRHKAFTDSMVHHRLATDKGRNDLLGTLISEGSGGQRLRFHVGRVRNMAAALSGIMYLLLTNPGALARLREEVRSTFSSAAEIKIGPVSKLPCLSAVLSKGLRAYPPQPTDLVRVVPAGGGVIAGHSVAGGVQPWSISHSRDHWAAPRPSPERFLASDDEARRAGNRLEALQPFSSGPRSCIGRPLVYAEMRLILARIMFEIDDMKPHDADTSSSDWIRPLRGYPLWDRPPLKVRFTIRT